MPWNIAANAATMVLKRHSALKGAAYVEGKTYLIKLASVKNTACVFLNVREAVNTQRPPNDCNKCFPRTELSTSYWGLFIYYCLWPSFNASASVKAWSMWRWALEPNKILALASGHHKQSFVSKWKNALVVVHLRPPWNSAYNGFTSLSAELITNDSNNPLHSSPSWSLWYFF